MRDGWKKRWGWRVSAIVLVGGVLRGWHGVDAGWQPRRRPQSANPFQQILHKLDKILDAVKG